jgi:probable F420-dependent oxidoreductase
MLYRMPTHFGPSLGPRQGAGGRRYTSAHVPKWTRYTVSFLGNREQLTVLYREHVGLAGNPGVSRGNHGQGVWEQRPLPQAYPPLAHHTSRNVASMYLGPIRVARLEESLHIIKRLFADEPVAFSGQHYTITNLKGLPKPVQRPHPPILLGGAGKRLLSLAAREADIVGIHVKLEGGKNFADMSGSALARRVGWIREAAGERFPQLELNLLILKVIITDRPYATIEQCIRNQGWGEYTGETDQANSLSGWSDMTVEQIIEMPYFFIGTVDQLVEKLQMLRERYGISYVTVFAEALDTFAPVVARLASS